MKPSEIQTNETLLTQDAGGRETTRIELRYLEICERVQDGTWRVMWGMDGPVQEYVAGSQGH